MFKKWKKGKIDRDCFIKEKKYMGEFLDRKRTEKRKEEEEKLKSLYFSADVWKFINKKRGKKS